MLSKEEQHDLEIYKANDLLNPEIADLFVNFCYGVIGRNYENRHEVLRLCHETRENILCEFTEHFKDLSDDRVMELNSIYWKILLMEAKNLQVDAYFLYLEKNRDPREKFYQPRRKVFLEHGITQGFQDLIDDKLDILCISLPPGTGKAQPLYSKVLTPNGFVSMGSVKVGDKVIAGNGNIANVIGVYPQGKQQVYEITLDDGSKCRCSDNHLWYAGYEEIDKYDRAVFNGSTVTTKEIREVIDAVDIYIPVYREDEDEIYISIKSIEYIGEEKCQCIMIDDPCHLYITDDYIITHNTTAEKFFHSAVIGWFPKDYSLFYSHSGEITGMYYRGVYQIVSDAQEYTWGEIFPNLKVTSTNAKSQQFNVGAYKPFPSLQTASVGSENAGKVRASKFLFVDDMIGKLEEALNKNILDKLWSAYSVDARQRKTKGTDGKFCKELHLATRWSVHDVIGRVQRAYEGNERVRAISVPDIDPETGRSNFLFDIGGFTVENFKDQELLMDEISYRCIYKQDPIEREGLLYHPDEVRTYDSLPLRDPDEVLGICDTKNTGTDYMFVPCFYRYDEDYYLVDCVCDSSVDFDVLFEKIVGLILENRMQRLEIESNQGGKPIGTTIRNKVNEKGWACNITEKPTESNKEARIIANSYWVKKHVLFKNKGDYTPKSDYGIMMSELFTWTQMGKNTHDDVPDGLANFALFVAARTYAKIEVTRNPFL